MNYQKSYYRQKIIVFSIGRVYFTSNEGPENIIVYQPTFNLLKLKKYGGTEYIIGWKSKGVYNSKFIALHGTFLPNIKYFNLKNTNTIL